MRQKLSTANNAFGYVVSLLFLRWWVSRANKPAGRFWTLPTAISLSRIPLGFAFDHYFLKGHQLAAFVVLLLAGLSDKMDGEMAKREGPSRWGALIDPWSDKAFVLICGIALLPVVWKSASYPLATIEILLFIVPFFALRRPDIDIKSTDFGKSKFGAECFALLAFTAGQTVLGNILFYMAIPLAVMSIKDKALQILRKL